MRREVVLKLIREKAKEQEGTELADALDEIADIIEDMPEERAVRTREFTQIHKGSPIAYPVWRCSNCGYEDRFKKGEFCKMCGWKFTEQPLFIVTRVDRMLTWFKGYDKDGRTQVTKDSRCAMQMSEGEAEIVMHDLKAERGGVWSARRVSE